MIGTIQIKCSAHNPSMPLCPVFAFQESYQQVRISDVPKKIGEWSIKRVEVECQFPDNKVGKFDCSLIGGVWATTISACSTAGTTKNGFVVNGYDENGNKYILGKSDLYIMTNDSRIVPQKELVVVNILPNKPDAPHVGDIVFVDGKFEIYDGEKWISNEYIESEDGKKRIYGNGDVRTLSSAPGTYGPWTDANGNTRTDLHIELVDSSVPLYIWTDSGFQFQSVPFHSLEEAQTATGFLESSPNAGTYWTRTYTPGTESWTKVDEIALKSDIPHVPTRTSELENDSDFATKTELDTVNQNLTTTVLDMQKELDQKATKTELEQLSAVVGTANTQLEEIA